MLAIFPTLNLSGDCGEYMQKDGRSCSLLSVDSLERSLEKMSCFFIFRIGSI